MKFCHIPTVSLLQWSSVTSQQFHYYSKVWSHPNSVTITLKFCHTPTVPLLLLPVQVSVRSQSVFHVVACLEARTGRCTITVKFSPPNSLTIELVSSLLPYRHCKTDNMEHQSKRKLCLHVSNSDYRTKSFQAWVVVIQNTILNTNHWFSATRCIRGLNLMLLLLEGVLEALDWYFHDLTLLH